MKKFSRALIVPVALLASNASAVCPFLVIKCKDLTKNSRLIASTIIADKVFDKNEHAKKAFVSTLGRALDKPDMSAEKFGHGLAIDYLIRRGSDVVGLDGLKKSVLKKIDVLPEGMARDLINPMVEGAVEVATHPETLTLLVMNHVLPAVLGSDNSKTVS